MTIFLHFLSKKKAWDDSENVFKPLGIFFDPPPLQMCLPYVTTTLAVKYSVKYTVNVRVMA